MIRNVLLAVAVTLFLSNASFAQHIIYTNDFEADGGGFVGDNDWERGIGTGFVGGFSSTEPLGGHSGDFIWGTIIGGDHSPSTVSTLTQNFDLSNEFGTELSFWEWSDSGGNTFDMARVLINGTQEYISDGNSNDAWRQITLDLSAYDNLASVDVAFVFSTTTVVERTGWYLDDVSITAIPEPTSLALVFGGLALVGLRRRRRA